MKIAIGELARRIGGEVKGDPDRLVSGTAQFEDANQRDVTLTAEASVLKRNWPHR